MGILKLEKRVDGTNTYISLFALETATSSGSPIDIIIISLIEYTVRRAFLEITSSWAYQRLAFTQEKLFWGPCPNCVELGAWLRGCTVETTLVREHTECLLCGCPRFPRSILLSRMSGPQFCLHKRRGRDSKRQ